jgi:hypothetical protein
MLNLLLLGLQDMEEIKNNKFIMEHEVINNIYTINTINTTNATNKIWRINKIFSYYYYDGITCNHYVY